MAFVLKLMQVMFIDQKNIQIIEYMQLSILSKQEKQENLLEKSSGEIQSRTL